MRQRREQMTNAGKEEERNHRNQLDRERHVKHRETMTVEEIEEEMRQHADKMRAHRTQTSQDNQNIVRKQTKRAMNLNELNERQIEKIQLCKHELNQGKEKSHENGGFSSNGMNSMTIDYVLKMPIDRL